MQRSQKTHGAERGPKTGAADRWLRRAGGLWFGTALIGQAGFIAFIVLYYGTRTLSGQFAAWNDKPIIKGYVAGDLSGNIMFAAHVLLAAVITLGGLMQLIEPLRRRFPALHRWNGRLFMLTALFMALGGIWLTWGRNTQLSQVSAIAITLNGALIVVCALIAWHHALRRRFDRHRSWAMRTFMLVNGVWFLRVGIMAWVLLNQGPVGMDGKLSGPADIALVFGCYLLPLGGLELYMWADRQGRALIKGLTAFAVCAATLFMALGIGGTIFLMWGPYMF